MTSSDNDRLRTRGPLWRLTDGYRKRIALLGAVTLAGALIEAAFLVLLTSALLGLAEGGREVNLRFGPALSLQAALVISAVAVVVRLGLSVVGASITARLSSDVTLAQRRRLAHAYLDADWPLQSREPSGRLQELLTSFVGRTTSAMLHVAQAVTAVLSLVAFIGTGVVVDPVATLAMLVALALLALCLAPIRTRIRRRSTTWAGTNLKFAGSIAEYGSLGQEIQTFGVREQVGERIDDLARANTDEQRSVQALNGLLTPLYTFLAYVAIIGGVLVLSRTGVGNLAAIGAVMLLLLRSLSYGQQLLTVAGQLTAAVPFLEGVDETFARYSTAARPVGVERPEGVAPLVLEDVSYRYAASREAALNGIDLTIERGQAVGVVGPSGAGKSTLAQVLLGLRLPDSGSITADGVPIADIERDWWTSKVSYVPQDPLLLTASVADNIRFFRSGLSDEAVVEAAVRANIRDEVERLPDGFATHLGERGSALSGGQRQRISIARALVGSPELLILDEPTSSLDAHSERLIRDTLAELRGKVTVVVIAHRVSTLELCDRIITIENGRVTSDGAPGDLAGHRDYHRILSRDVPSRD